MELVYKEFRYKEGEFRNLGNLAIILQNLKFFKPYDKAQREIICKTSKIVKLEPRTVIFEQGQKEDYQYIIIKGRVSLEIKKPELGDLPIIIGMRGDGEIVGQLTMSKGLQNIQAERGTTCITVDESYLLKINRQLSVVFNHLQVKINHHNTNIKKQEKNLQKKRIDFLISRVEPFREFV